MTPITRRTFFGTALAAAAGPALAVDPVKRPAGPPK